MTEHYLEKEEDGTERLVLGGRAHPTNGEAGDKRRDALLPEFSRMTLPMKDDEAPNPDVCLLGPPTVVPKTDRLSHAIEELRKRPSPSAMLRGADELEFRSDRGT